MYFGWPLEWTDQTSNGQSRTGCYVRQTSNKIKTEATQSGPAGPIAESTYCAATRNKLGCTKLGSPKFRNQYQRGWPFLYSPFARCGAAWFAGKTAAIASQNAQRPFASRIQEEAAVKATCPMRNLPHETQLHSMISIKVLGNTMPSRHEIKHIGCPRSTKLTSHADSAAFVLESGTPGETMSLRLGAFMITHVEDLYCGGGAFVFQMTTIRITSAFPPIVKGHIGHLVRHAHPQKSVSRR